MGKLEMYRGLTIAPAQAQAVSFPDDEGNAIQISSADVKSRICPEATDNEIAFFMEMCRVQHLNPWNRDAYLVKYKGNPAQMVVAHKVVMARAERNEQFDGMEYGVVVMRDGALHNEQRRAFYRGNGEALVGGWCRIYRKDRRVPYYTELSLDEMSKQQSTWKTMPAVMITKCAQAACVREAFPDELGGLYTDAEGGQDIEVEVEPVGTPESATRVEPRRQASDEDLGAPQVAHGRMRRRGLARARR